MDNWWLILAFAAMGIFLVWAQAQKPKSAEQAGAARRLRLQQETADWSLPVFVRTYETNDAGNQLFMDEANVLVEHGYEPALQSAEGSHLHAGRLLLTGGLSVLAGEKGIRSKGRLTVTFTKRDQPV